MHIGLLKEALIRVKSWSALDLLVLAFVGVVTAFEVLRVTRLHGRAFIMRRRSRFLYEDIS